MFLGVMVIYLTISIAGFVVLGDSMTKANILDNMEGNWILYTVIFLVTSHFFLGFIIVVNPVSQDLESLLGIEDSELYTNKYHLALNFGNNKSSPGSTLYE